MCRHNLPCTVPVQYLTGKKTPGERAGAHKDRYVCRAAREKVPVEAYGKRFEVRGRQTSFHTLFTHVSTTTTSTKQKNTWGATPSSTPACLARRV